MSSNLAGESIQDGHELNRFERMKFEIVIPGSDFRPEFDALGEVFGAMAEPVVTVVGRTRRFAVFERSGGDGVATSAFKPFRE